MLHRFEARLAQPLSREMSASGQSTVIINVRSAGYAIPDLREDESYTLGITPTRATLTANTVVGAIRGMETLLQLQVRRQRRIAASPQAPSLMHPDSRGAAC